MTRGGRTKDRSEPERRCIVSGATEPKAGLIRFVVGPGDVVTPDLAGKLPGRGLWVTAERAALEKAVQKKAFARAARRPVEIPADLVDMTANLLVRRLTDTLGLARKAGQAVAGYEKVKSLLESERAEVLVQARDGSPAMKKKLRAPHGRDSLITCLDAQELGVAFGRETVIHAALSAGGLASLCLSESARLNGLRGTAPKRAGFGSRQIGMVQV